MQLKFRTFIFFLSFLAVGIPVKSQVDLHAYKDQLYLGNIFYGSQNPVSVTYAPFENIGDIDIKYNYQNGELKPIDKAKKEQWWSGTIYGIKKLKRVAFEGGITYNNGLLKERRWNNTLFVSGYNPYIICDSVKSKFSTETFNLNGTASYIINEKFTAALRADYNVGSSATQNDPRPDIKGMRFNLNPGAQYKYKDFYFGLSANVGWLSESATHTVVRTEIPHYVFLFQGLGMYEAKTAVGYMRKYNGFNYGANIQFAYDKNGTIANFLELGYYNEEEKAIDGTGAERYKGGRYNGNDITLSDRFEIRSGNIRHNITLNGRMHNTDGTWYTQTQRTDENGNMFWDVVNEDVEYKGKEYMGNIDYRFDMLKANVPMLTVNVNVGVKQSDTKHNVYSASQKYTVATADAYVAKRFDIDKVQLMIFVDGTYNYNLSSDLYTGEFPQTIQYIVRRYTEPAYYALTTDWFRIGGGIQASVPVKIRNYRTMINVKAGYDYSGYISGETGNFDNLKDSNRHDIKCSIGLTF